MRKTFYTMTIIFLCTPFLLYSQNEHQVLLKRYFESLKVTPECESFNAQISLSNTTLDWSTPELVCSDRTNPQMPSICIDQDYQPHISWVEIDIDTMPFTQYIYYSKKEGSEWHYPILLSDDCDGGIFPRLVTFRRYIHVLWQTSLWSTGDPNQKIYWARYDGFSWHNCNEISSGIWESGRKAVVDATGNIYFGSSHNGFFGEKNGLYLNYYNEELWNSHKINSSGTQVNLFIDNEQNLHRVWVTSGTTSNSDVWYAFSEDSGKTWPLTKNIFSGEGYSHFPIIVVDQQGVRHVVWLEDVNLNIFPDAIYYSSSTDGSIWTEKKILAGPFPPDLIWSKEVCIDSKGRLHVFWSEGEAAERNLYYCFGSQQDWSGIEQVFSTNYNGLAGYFGLTMDNQDHLHLTFKRSGAIYYCSSEPVTSKVNDKEENPRSPANFVLQQNYPNPFNSVTEISYQVALSGRVVIAVYNIQGHLVRTLVDENKSAGNYAVQWDGLNDSRQRASSGIYLCRLVSGGSTFVRKMVLTY